MPVLLPQISHSQQRDIQSTPLPRITPSALRDLSCTKRYHATRVAKTAWQEKQIWPITTPRGSAYHDALYALHAQRTGAELPIKHLAMFARNAVYRARYERDVDLQAEQLIVEAMVMLFLDNQDPEDIEAIRGLEEEIEFQLLTRQGSGLALMSAKIDRRLVRLNNPMHLVLQDFKSGNYRSIDLQEAFLLLWCAKQEWCKKDDPNRFRTLSLEYIWNDLNEHQVYVDVITTDMVRCHQKYLIDSVERAILAEPIENPGPHCCWCPIRKRCQAGSTVMLAEGEMVF